MSGGWTSDETGMEPCPACDGSGLCEACLGAGTTPDAGPAPDDSRTCPACGGSGLCPECG